jgi:membrane protein
VLPEGSEFLALRVVLRHFVDAQRNGVALDTTTVRMAEPCLRSESIAAYFEALARADIIHRRESGGWMMARSLDSTDLLRVYRHSGYPLPPNPTQQAAASRIELPPELLAVLDQLARSIDTTLGTRLDKVYPVASPSNPPLPES